MKKFLQTCGVFVVAGLALVEGATAAPATATASGQYGYINGDLTYTAPDGDVTYFCTLGKGIVYAIVDVPTTGKYTGCAYARHVAGLPVHESSPARQKGAR